MDRQHLGGRDSASPAHSCEPKRNPISAGCLLGIEPAEELSRQIRVTELREVGERRMQRRDEVEATRSIENFFSCRKLARAQEAVDVDQPLTARRGGRAGTERAGEDQLVSRVQDERRALDLGEIERPLAEETQCLVAERPCNRQRQSMVDEEEPAALVAQAGERVPLSCGPPARVARDLDRSCCDLALHDQIDLRHRAQPESWIPAEESGHAAYEHGPDVGTLQQEGQQNRKPVEQ